MSYAADELQQHVRFTVCIPLDSWSLLLEDCDQFGTSVIICLHEARSGCCCVQLVYPFLIEGLSRKTSET